MEPMGRQVNVHYIKPVTLAAGGMSYALMKHPEGLPQGSEPWVWGFGFI